MREELQSRTSSDVVLRALADRRRRCVVAHLSGASERTASVIELADHVTAHTDADDPERVANRLHHVTLPKLEDAGLLEYDPGDETVRYCPKPWVETLLDTIIDTAEG